MPISNPNNPVIGESGILDWQVITQSQSLAPGAYLVDSSALVNLLLPTSAQLGDQIVVKGNNSTSWRVTQNNGQQIQVGMVTTSLGLAGRVGSTAPGDGITLLCTSESGSSWTAIDINGNLEVV